MKPAHIFKDKYTEKNEVAAAVFCILALNEKIFIM